MEKTTFIYALCCPITGQILYIGQSQNPALRFAYHTVTTVEGSYKREVMQAFSSSKMPLEPEIIEEVPKSIANERENYYIELSYRAGQPLLNGYVPKAIRAEYHQRNLKLRPTKFCGECRREYPNTIEHFGHIPSCWDGLCPVCRKCIEERQRKQESKARSQTRQERISKSTEQDDL